MTGHENNQLMNLNVIQNSKIFYVKFLRFIFPNVTLNW